MGYITAMGYQNSLDALSVLTEHQRSDIEKGFGAADNIFVIPNPVLPPTSLGDQLHSNRLIATIARFEPQKSIDRAIFAFKELLKRVPDAKFHIYGGGPLHQDMSKLIKKLGMDHAVTLPGYDPRARERLNDAVCYWNTSQYEGYPLATLEAMSQGCPVVAYDVKYGLREQIKDGYNGFLIKEDDIETFVERTISIMEDRELFNRLSKGAIETAQNHSPEKFLADTSKVLWEIVEKKSRRTKIERIKLINRTVRFAEYIGFTRVRFNLQLSLKMELLIDFRSTLSPLNKEHFFLKLVSPQSDQTVNLPLRVEIAGNKFSLSSEVSSAEMEEAIRQFGQEIRHIELQVGFAWGNSTWIEPISKRIRVLVRKDRKPYALVAIPRITFRKLRNKVRSMIKT